jgi:Uma2 family endonuclease
MSEAIAHALVAPVPDAQRVDHQITMHDVTWEQYEGLLGSRGEKANPRMTFFRGILEIMSPSRQHEAISRMHSLLLAVYAEEKGIDLRAFGNWTLKLPEERGCEPDECFVMGGPESDVPDLAIEVVWTADLGNKLAVYAGLGVAEVWVWRKGRIEVLVLAASGYEPAPRSRLLPDLDLMLFARFVTRPDQIQAMKEYRAALGG